MSEYSVTTIDLLRHGLPEGGEIFRGTTNVQLTAIGFEQMTQATEKLASSDVIITSPLQRCASFAEHAASVVMPNASYHEDAGLREVSFGDWDGMTFQDVEAQYGDQYHHYWRDPVNNTPPNAEPIAEFLERISLTIQTLAQAYKGQHLLLVTHGGVIRAALSYALGCELSSLMRYEVPYASISQIKIYHTDDDLFPQLVFHNR